MARRKDVEWSLPEGDLSPDRAAVSVLMDIRDELKTINLILGCHRFMAIPSQIERIEKNTRKPRRRKKK